MGFVRVYAAQERFDASRLREIKSGKTYHDRIPVTTMRISGIA
jgi:hypothetical protein